MGRMRLIAAEQHTGIGEDEMEFFGFDLLPNRVESPAESVDSRREHGNGGFVVGDRWIGD
jgi:hypothetical protein